MVAAMRVIGTAGGSLSGMQTQYGANNVRTGKQGERKTVKTLDRVFGGADDIWLFNDLRMPGRKGRDGQDANIDHVILRGNNVIVLDSKNWKPGLYFSLAHHGFRAPLNSMPHLTSGTVRLAIDRLTRLLPNNAAISGLTLVHPTRPGTVNTWFIRPKGGTRIYPANSTQATAALRRLAGPAAIADGQIIQKLQRLTHKT